MRIALLAPLEESVPPKHYGGTELMVSLLTEGLVAAGHEVTLFASGDSHTTAELISIAPQALRLDQTIPARRWSAYALRQLLEYERRNAQFDIVHNHMGYEAFAMLDKLNRPNVSTNHNPVKDYCAPIFFRYSHLPLVSISHAYRRLNHADKLNYVATVYNGIDLSCFSSNQPQHRSFLLFLGRLGHDKGTAEAIEIAVRLKVPLKIAGKVDKSDQAYYEKFVAPRLDPPDIEYIGEVNFSKKIELLQKSIAVVYPINFDEPFGLVIAESLAAGTPLLAFERGSVPELIVDGEHGVVGKTIDDLVRRFPEIEKISAENCKQRARRFSKEEMVKNYSELYKQICR